MNSNSEHLTFEELESLAAGRSLHGRSHAETCGACAQALQRLEQFSAATGKSMGRGRDQDCPPLADWRSIAAGIHPHSEELLAHAAACDRCASMLKIAQHEISEPLLEEERAFAASLPSSSPRWQREFVRRQFDAPRSRLFSVYFRPALALAAVFVLVAVTLFVLMQKSPQQLTEVAYGDYRTLELRFANAPYGEIRKVRAPGSQFDGSQFDLPVSYLSARTEVAKNSSKMSRGDWLQARGRLEVLAWDSDRARLTLEQAKQLLPESNSILIDLASANYQLGEQGDKEAYARAADLLLQVIQKDKTSTEAHFNLAIVYERMGMLTAARDTWTSFLTLEKDPLWRAEAEQRLHSLRDRSLTTPPPVPIETQVEMGLLSPNPFPASAVLGPPALRLAQERNDQWLLEFLKTRHSPAFAGSLHSLREAIRANSLGDRKRALEQAESAARGFQAQRNVAGWMRAEFERVHAVQRSGRGQDCLALLDRLDESALKTFPWLRVQFMLERTACENMTGSFRNARETGQQALLLATQHGFSELRLRALGFLASVDSAAGDWNGSLERDIAGLNDYYRTPANPLRGYQFLSSIALYAGYQGLDLLERRLWCDAAELVATTANRATGAMAFARCGRAALRAADRDQAHLSFAQATRLLSALPDSKAKQVYEAEIALGRAQLDGDFGDRSSDLLERYRKTATESQNRFLLSDFFRVSARRLETASRIAEADAEYDRSIQTSLAALPSQPNSADLFNWRKDATTTYQDAIRFYATHGGETKALRVWQQLRTGRNDGAKEADGLSAAPTQVLSYGVLKDAVIIWTHGPAGTRQKLFLEEPSLLRAKLNRFARLCATRDSSMQELTSLAADLYQQLVFPFEDLLRNQPLLSIELDPELPPFPFQALVDSRGVFVGEKWALLVSAGARPSAAPRRNPNQRFLIVIGAGGKAGELEESASESQAVSTFQPQATLLYADQVSAATLAQHLRSAKGFHFVGHGRNDVQASGLVLSALSARQNTPELFTAADLSKSDLRGMDLAVLGSCESASGISTTIYRPQSLARALIVAGTRRVVASQWNVDSATTLQFMRAFYSQLPTTTPELALRHASAQIVATRKHPYYWAPFVTIEQ